MVLVFILCAIVVFICVVIFSTIRIQFNNFTMSNINDDKNILSRNYKIIASVHLFNKIKWLSIKLNDKKIKKIYNKMNLEKMDLKTLQNDFKIKNLEYLKKLNLKISYLHLKFKIGTEDVVATSFVVAIISSIIGILLPHVVKKYEKDKYYYKIIPLYINKNVYEIKFDCIIEIKNVHIINIIYVFIKKRRDRKYEQRASNRRSYGYSYE